MPPKLLSLGVDAEDGMWFTAVTGLGRIARLNKLIPPTWNCLQWKAGVRFGVEFLPRKDEL